MASTCESIDEALAAQLQLIDDFKFDEAELLMARLEGKLAVDFDTARRLFTLVSALRWKG